MPRRLQTRLISTEQRFQADVFEALQDYARKRGGAVHCCRKRPPKQIEKPLPWEGLDSLCRQFSHARLSNMSGANIILRIANFYRRKTGPKGGRKAPLYRLVDRFGEFYDEEAEG